MIEEILISAGFGIAGSLVRLLTASLKNLRQGKISWSGFGFYVATVIAVGAFSGIVLGFGKVLSFLAGYAGLDLIEGYYNIFKKKKFKLYKKD